MARSFSLPSTHTTIPNTSVVNNFRGLGLHQQCPKIPFLLRLPLCPLPVRTFPTARTATFVEMSHFPVPFLVAVCFPALIQAVLAPVHGLSVSFATHVTASGMLHIVFHANSAFAVRARAASYRPSRIFGKSTRNGIIPTLKHVHALETMRPQISLWIPSPLLKLRINIVGTFPV